MNDDLLLDAMSYCTPKHILRNPLMHNTVLNRIKLVKDAFEQYYRWNGVYLNEDLLRETVESCYCDIYRLRVFRGIEQEDKHKQAAFLMKWIVKIRPVQIQCGFKNTPQSVLLINEILAVSTAFVILRIPPASLLKNPRYGDYVRNMLYLLHFHSCSPEQLSSELFLLERNVAETKSI
jgi:hypothetical protein